MAAVVDADEDAKKPVRVAEPMAHQVGCCTRHVASAYVRFPCLFLLAYLGVVCVVGLHLNSSMNKKASIFNQAGVFDWTITNTTAALNTDMYNSAVLKASKTRGDSSVAPMSSGSSNRYVLNVMYEYKNLTQDVSIFTPTTLQDMCKFENIWLGHENYTKFCIRPDNEEEPGNCTLPAMSVLSRFYDREKATSGDLANRPLSFIDQSTDPPTKTLTRNCSALPWDGPYGVHASSHALNVMIEDPKMRELGGFFMSAKSLASDDKAIGYTPLTRSMLQLGAPLKGYADEYDRTLEQSVVYHAEFMESVEREMFRYTGMKSKEQEDKDKTMMPMFVQSPYTGNATLGSHMRLEFYAFSFNILEFDRAVVGDFMWALGSILFVTIYVGSHIGSVFLTAISMFQIIMSLPLAYFIYTHVLSIPFFTELHVLAIFLCLGVGADDIFVFMDCWNQCKVDPAFKKDMRKILEVTLSRTAVAVFNTSFTTAMSFVATATSPIMPLHSFGIYAALAIMILYVLAITVTPVAVVVYHTYLACCFCRRCDDRITSDKERRREAQQQPGAAEAGTIVTGAAAATDAGQGTTDIPAEEKKLPCTERVFKHCWAPILNFVVCRIKLISLIFVILFTGYVAQGAYFAMQLRTPEEQEKFFGPEHMFSSVVDRLSNDFLSGADSSYLTVHVTFGLKSLTRDKYNIYIPNENRGDVSFADDFDLAGDKAAQKHFWKLCSKMREKKCDLDGCFNSKYLARQDTADKQYTKCWIEDFAAFRYANDKNNRIASRIIAGECSSVADCMVLPTDVPTAAQRTNETWIMEWMPESKAEFISEAKLFRDHAVYGASYKNAVGIVDDKLKFAVFSSMITLRTRQPYMQSKDIHAMILAMGEEWQADKDYPTSLGKKHKIVFSDVRWFSWADTEEGLLKGMFQGLQICMPVAFLVLLWASSNFILAFLATFCIAGIVASVLGMCKSVMGWHLGIAESISAVIVVGFAVDYIVHLCHIYAEAKSPPGEPDKTRGERVEEALTVMGVTVVAGAVTTLGAGSFMFLCKMVFFTKMAFLMTATIIHSFLFALVYFMAILALAGPTGSFGDVPALWSCKAKGQTDADIKASVAKDVNDVTAVPMGDTEDEVAGSRKGVSRSEI